MPGSEQCFIERMRRRGNQEEFIEKIVKSCTELYKTRKNDNMASVKIDLSGCEYLSDIVVGNYKDSLVQFVLSNN